MPEREHRAGRGDPDTRRRREVERRRRRRITLLGEESVEAPLVGNRSRRAREAA
jgi:hypothetical protein